MVWLLSALDSEQFRVELGNGALSLGLPLLNILGVYRGDHCRGDSREAGGLRLENRFRFRASKAIGEGRVMHEAPAFSAEIGDSLKGEPGWTWRGI